MGDPTEFKFVFKSYSGVVGRTTDLVTLMSSLSKMRTGTTERSAAELSKRWRKTRAKERAMRTRRVGSSQSYAAENGVTTFSCWHGKEKEVNRVRSSSSSTLMVGFVAINQFSVDFVTSVHVCPKSYATHATLSLKVWGMREVVYNETNLHGEVFT